MDQSTKVLLAYARAMHNVATENKTGQKDDPPEQLSQRAYSLVALVAAAIGPDEMSECVLEAQAIKQAIDDEYERGQVKTGKDEK